MVMPDRLLWSTLMFLIKLLEHQPLQGYQPSIDVVREKCTRPSGSDRSLSQRQEANWLPLGQGRLQGPVAEGAFEIFKGGYIFYC